MAGYVYGNSGFRNLVQTLVQSGMQIVDDLRDPVTYVNVTGTGYNTETGQPSVASTTITGLFGLISKFESADIDGKVVFKSDLKLSIAYLDLPIVPSTNDTVTSTLTASLLFGQTWKVQRWMNSAGSPLWAFHLRAI